MGNYSYFHFAYGSGYVDVSKLKKSTIEYLRLCFSKEAIRGDTLKDKLIQQLGGDPEAQPEEVELPVHLASEIKAERERNFCPLQTILQSMDGYKIQGYWYTGFCNALIDINNNLVIQDKDKILVWNESDDFHQKNYDIPMPLKKQIIPQLVMQKKETLDGISAFFEEEDSQFFFIHFPGIGQEPSMNAAYYSPDEFFEVECTAIVEICERLNLMKSRSKRLRAEILPYEIDFEGCKMQMNKEIIELLMYCYWTDNIEEESCDDENDQEEVLKEDEEIEDEEKYYEEQTIRRIFSRICYLINPFLFVPPVCERSLISLSKQNSRYSIM